MLQNVRKFLPGRRPHVTQSGHCQALDGGPEFVAGRLTTQTGVDMALFNVGFVIFPNVTQLDFTGPLQVLSGLPQSTTHIVAKSMSPVLSDCRLGLVPTNTFANCPPLDLICIPGGSEGVAGLLRRRRATTHWAYTDLLPLVGAKHEKARVVIDGNVITAGGVTSGIDFGLAVVAEISGESIARRIQLGMEYDPAPPFDSGHPDRAPSIRQELMSARYDKFRSIYRSRIEQAAQL